MCDITVKNVKWINAKIHIPTTTGNKLVSLEGSSLETCPLWSPTLTDLREYTGHEEPKTQLYTYYPVMFIK